MSHIEFELLLPYLSVLIAAVASVGAIASAFVSRKVYLSQTRPNVIVYVEHDRSKGSIVLWIRNIGNGVAYDVSFDLNNLPGLDRVDRGFIDKLNANGIKMLAPGGAINSIVGVASDAVFRENVGVIPAQVYYYANRDTKGPKFCDEFFLDYDAFIGSIYADTEEHQTRIAVQKIADSIDKNGSNIKGEISRSCANMKTAIERLGK